MSFANGATQSVTINTDKPADQPGLRASLRRAWPQVWPILVVGLALRILFLLVGAKIYYAGRQVDIYTNGDSYSYVLSFRNLLDFGRYTFDMREPEAAVGRLPGYPFFYGVHYLLFGAEWVTFAVALSQVLFDTIGIWLIFTITTRLATPESWAPYVAALLLAFYPFTIVWVPIIGTETMGVFFTLLWWATLLLMRRRTANWLLLGSLLSVVLYVREYLGVCVAVTIVYLLLNAGYRDWTAAVRPIILVLVGFMALYMWWPARNYVTLGRFIPLKPAAAGYANLREDAQAALAWMLTWTNDVTMGFDEVQFAEKPSFPDHVIHTPAEKQLMDTLIVMSRSCASSFFVRAHPYILDAEANVAVQDLARTAQLRQLHALRANNCNAQVKAGFDRLRASYIERHPIRSRLEVPLANFQKILFKSQFKTADGEKLTMAQRVSALLFTWRSILLALGLIGAWRYRRQVGLWPALLFAAIIFAYMASIFRTMEMRYLLQADVLMLVPAALLLNSWIPRRWFRFVRTVPAT